LKTLLILLKEALSEQELYRLNKQRLQLVNRLKVLLKEYKERNRTNNQLYQKAELQERMLDEVEQTVQSGVREVFEQDLTERDRLKMYNIFKDLLDTEIARLEKTIITYEAGSKPNLSEHSLHHFYTK